MFNHYRQVVQEMKIKSIKVITIYQGEEGEPGIDIYRFNDDCQLEREEHPGSVSEHYYLPEGVEYETLTRIKEGDSFRVCFDYDDEGSLVSETKKDKYGSVVNKVYYDWIKPGRVCSICQVYKTLDASYLDHYCWREYYDRAGRLVFTRGYGWYETREYGVGHLRLTKIGFDLEGEHKPDRDMILSYNDDGLFIGSVCEDGKVGTANYEFDRYGNWIKMEGSIDGGPVSVIKEREIEYTSGIWDCDNSVVRYYSTDCHFTDKEWIRE